MENTKNVEIENIDEGMMVIPNDEMLDGGMVVTPEDTVEGPINHPMSIENYLSKMTLFYSKQDGQVVSFSTGIQDMTHFQDRAIDFELIYDFIVVDYDEYVLMNYEKFKVEDGKLKFNITDSISKYL